MYRVIFFIKNDPLTHYSTNNPITRKIEALVEKILSITQDNDCPESSEKQEKVKELEREIDGMVYELYELTPEETGIVEGKISTETYLII